MNVAEIITVVAGSLLLLTAMVVVMNRSIQSERQRMDRRLEEWQAKGAVPEEKPNFYSGYNQG